MGDIAVLFQRATARAAKKVAAASPSPAPAATVVDEEAEEIVNPSPVQSVVLSEALDVEDVMPPQPPSPVSLPVYDINRLPYDPGERLPIASYPVNDQDAIRRAYVLKGPFKPIEHEFPIRTIGDRDRSCNPVWLYTHNWVEYSIKKDAIFCFPCYLFKDPENKGKGTIAFTVEGWRNWNIGNKALLRHMGSKAGTGLNQEMGLPRPGDTRWGSHYKTVCNIITMYPSIHDVLVTLGDDTSHRADWTKIHFMVGAFESFEFVLIAHLNVSYSWLHK
ncbi:unnamed protein product [Urochloa humidicola]